MRTADKILSGPSRREVLTSALAGGFVLAFHLPVEAAVNEPQQPPDSTAGKFAPNAFIRIAPSGETTFVMPQVEMGQGVYTSISMIIAEELDADFSRLTLEHAPPSDKLYGNPLFGIQATGNSNSIRAFWKPLRTASATARAMLVQAAAQQWQVDPSSCTASNSVVSHKDSGRSLSYGALADAAQQQSPPSDVKLKDPKDFTLIGKPLPRLDTPDKVNGKVVYGIDAILPGMKFATIKACPVFGGRVAKVDDRAAKKIPGVRNVVVLESAVAVVGDHMWAAQQGLDALDITWNEGPNVSIGSKEIWDNLRAVSEKDGAVAKSTGDLAKAFASGERIDAVFELPFLAHATMEPMNCTAQVTPDGCELWLGTQIMSRVQSEVAKALALPPEKVTVNNHYIGGGFGRRLEPDMAISAALVAKQAGAPVKVVWSREEDIRHDVYRPVYRNTISATLADGRIAAWKHRIAGSSVMARWFPPGFQNGVDIDGVDCAIDMPYDIPNFRVEFARAEPPAVPTGFWRGVGPNNNVFAIECFMDELARKAGKDPIAFRRPMLPPRLQAALDFVAEKSDWGKPLPPRTGRGVSVQPAFASFIATVVEAFVDDFGEPHLRRVTCVVDTGIAINPNTVMAQLQGGLIFGFTAALYGEVTIDKGRVQQSNFNDYRMLRINQTPPIEVHVVKSGESPGGIGETGVAAGPPALRNAIYAATGVPLRRLPIDRSLLAVGKKT
ncbi:MAG: xanthine dehydrogenase family protein molybdopterin-binding subunit [Bradyrhizobiaceae bacterium]|nr:MAG: xanthine dehydrogenase family protein molybdopterin-binding subunit [Bradyrhizobiaceae bacterium]